MRQVFLEAPGKLDIRNVVEPDPGPEDVVIRVRAVGICGSDVHVFAGQHPFVQYPVVPGHEFSGTIESTGSSVSTDLVGRSACVEPSFVCGRCGQCLSGRYNICSELRVMGFQAPGAMCEAVAVPLAKVHLLPGRMDFRTGALVEPAAVAVHAFRRSSAKSGDVVLVIGAGVIGTMVMQVALGEGCRVACVEADPERLKRAARAGAEMTFDAQVTPEAIRDATDGALSAIFECVGLPETIQLAVDSAPRGSTVVAAGVFSEAVPIPMPIVQDGEIDIKGTLMYTGEDFRRAIELLARGAIRPADFITHVVGLEQVERGYRLLLDRSVQTMKVLVEPGG